MNPKEAIYQVTDEFYGPNLDTKMAAKHLNVACQTLANWRSKRVGPAYVKMAGKIIYRRSDLDSYLAAHRIDPSGSRN